MKIIQYILFLSLFLFSVLLCYPQTKIIEQLKQDISKAATEEQKIQAIFLLCDQGYSLHPDTLMWYAQKAGNMALKMKDRLSEVKAMYYKSAALTNKGLVDSSLNIADKCLEILKSKGLLGKVSGNQKNRFIALV